MEDEQGAVRGNDQGQEEEEERAVVKDNRGEMVGWQGGCGGGARGNRWKVNGPGADPPDALGLDIWARGLARGIGFQRYIISFEEQHHSGQIAPTHPYPCFH